MVTITSNSSYYISRYNIKYYLINYLGKTVKMNVNIKITHGKIAAIN